jgi:BirA family transcriptional regulator, biotin operon repressor / biotin---[acetyl-CoA-carboxylase] ligase
VSDGFGTTHRGNRLRQGSSGQAEAPTPARVPDDVVEAVTRLRERLGAFANNVKWFHEVGSTNDVAMRLAEQGFPEGTLVGSDMQSAGRGRHGREWASPPGAGLYVSVILRPGAAVAPLLTLAAGVAVADGIREATGLVVSLKWPNDVYIGSRKLAGILAEAGTSGSGLSFVVLGIGVNLMPAAYSSEIAGRATSLEFELARPIDRGLVLAACLAALVARYRQLRSSKTKQLIDAWRILGASMFGRPVECVRDHARISGVAEDIDDEGALVVRTRGELIRVVSGEVLWR